MFLPKVSVNASTDAIAQAISSSRNGVLMISDLPHVPFNEIANAFDHLASQPDITDRLNKAYAKNLVYKDAYRDPKNITSYEGGLVDMKRVLDLSPERLLEISRNDPGLAMHKGALGQTLAYWEYMHEHVAPKIVDAVSEAVGSPAVKEDASFNFRMVDYYERERDAISPRCGEHRDFGSFTLIFPTHSGLQINIDGNWNDVEVPESGTAIMLFGWCTQIRSNGRIPAVLHRVTDNAVSGDIIPRRIAAVLFCAPKLGETALEPVVREGEERVYISGVKAGDLRGKMARKWQKREGTLSDEGKVLEEAEILATNMYTQDDVVKQTLTA